jgi:hypothetical protein
MRRRYPEPELNWSVDAVAVYPTFGEWFQTYSLSGTISNPFLLPKELHFLNSRILICRNSQMVGAIITGSKVEMLNETSTFNGPIEVRVMNQFEREQAAIVEWRCFQQIGSFARGHWEAYCSSEMKSIVLPEIRGMFNCRVNVPLKGVCDIIGAKIQYGSRPSIHLPGGIPTGSTIQVGKVGVNRNYRYNPVWIEVREIVVNAVDEPVAKIYIPEPLPEIGKRKIMI